MDAAHVQNTSVSSATAVSGLSSSPLGTSDGSMIVVYISRQSATAVTVTDTAGNTYFQFGGTDYFGSGTNRMALWIAFNTVGHPSNVITVTLTSGTAAQFMLGVREFSGLGSYDPRGQGSGNFLTGTSMNSASTLAVLGYESVFVAIGEADGGGITPKAGYTGGLIGSSTFFSYAYKIVTAPENPGFTMASGASRMWSGSMNNYAVRSEIRPHLI